MSLENMENKTTSLNHDLMALDKIYMNKEKENKVQ